MIHIDVKSFGDSEPVPNWCYQIEALQYDNLMSILQVDKFSLRRKTFSEISTLHVVFSFYVYMASLFLIFNYVEKLWYNLRNVKTWELTIFAILNVILEVQIDIGSYWRSVFLDLYQSVFNWFCIFFININYFFLVMYTSYYLLKV